jgi:Uma2 family endonuclease
MEAAVRINLLSVDDYLSGELRSEVRHEYVAGSIFAMAGASEEHNDLAGNLYTALRPHLRNGPCKAFVVDMKVRAAVGRESVFYYPDVLVACDPRDTDKYFKRFPKVIIEVLSPDTERTDRREKFMAYTGIETFEEYVLVAQERMEVTIFRRATQWAGEVLATPTDKLALASLNFSLSLSTVYEGVKV